MNCRQDLKTNEKVLTLKKVRTGSQRNQTGHENMQLYLCHVNTIENIKSMLLKYHKFPKNIFYTYAERITNYNSVTTKTFGFENSNWFSVEVEYCLAHTLLHTYTPSDLNTYERSKQIRMSITWKIQSISTCLS